MSDKNFKVKNGIDANGAVTITQPDTSTVPLTISANSLATGSDLFQVKRPDGTVRFAVGNDGALSVKSNINFTGGSMTMYPGNSGQSALIVNGQTNQSVANLIVKAATGQTGDLTQWIKPDNTVLAKVDYLGSIYNSGLVEIGRTKTSDGSSAVNFITVGSYAGAGGQSTISRGSGYNGSLVLANYGNGSIILNQGGTDILTITNTGSATFSSDLTVTGNFTVNGTTTNLNSTNLVVEDKNIIIADVATPTDTTADGAGITIKGATDKTFNWVQSTGSFTSSEPLIINNTSTTTIPLIVKGYASQTGDLTDWLDSNSNILSSIKSNGSFYVTGNSNTVWISGPSTSGTNRISSNGNDLSFSPYFDGLFAPANSAGKWRPSNDNTSDLGSSGQRWKTLYSSGISVVNSTAANVLVTIKAASSQTGNLTEWQNSSGTILSKIDSSGAFKTAATASFGTINGGGVWGGYAPTVEIRNSSASTSAINIFAAAGPAIRVYDGSGYQRGSWNQDGSIVVGQSNTKLATLSVYVDSAATIGAIIRGATSQSANLQEWQNSSGLTVASMDVSGKLIVPTLRGPAGSVITLGTDLQPYSLSISNTQFNSYGPVPWRPYNTSMVGFIIKGLASQTANLQEWQDSTGTALARVDASGNIYPNSIVSTGGNANSFGGNTTAGVILSVHTNGATGQIIRGSGAQTLNLQEWQNSAGSVLASINSSGNIYTSNGFVTPADLRVANGLISYGYDNTYSAIIAVVAGSPTNQTTLIIKKRNSTETGDFQQWQNSSGTVMAKVDSNGYITSGIFYANSNHYARYQIVGGRAITALDGTTAMGMVNWNTGLHTLQLRNVASQTADSLRIENSSGTAIARIDASGNLSAVSKSFDIPHPTKENMRLRYASLEGPENGVYIRGTAESNIIELPEYWTGLVHEDSITVSLTAVGSAQNIYVEKIEDNKVYIGGELIKAFFTVYGERKDIDNLTVEY